MAVAPTKVERITPDQSNVRDRERVRHRLGPEHALAGHLIDALSARADTPQRGGLVAAHALVAPSDAQTRIRFLLDLARLDGRAASLLPTHRKLLAVSC